VLAGVAGCATSAPVTSQPAPDRGVAVAAPVVDPPSGPAGQRQRPCTAKDLVSSASLSPAVDGVLGVISIAGTHCSLSVDVTRIRLLGADGRVLAVPAGSADMTNPAESVRPDLAEDVGAVRVGFAWTGSYCGPPARSVEIPALPAVIRIPLRGASATCRNASTSRLIPGVVDAPGSPVEPAPRAWTSLRVRLVLPKVVRPGAIPASVVLTNSADVAVSLAAPCPTTSAAVMMPLVPSQGYGGNFGQDGAFAGDLCRSAISVPAKGSVTVALPHLITPPEDPRNPWQKGGKLSVDWFIAGVPTAHATATIG
jgi:hypothetical protein